MMPPIVTFFLQKMYRPPQHTLKELLICVDKKLILDVNTLHSK